MKSIDDLALVVLQQSAQRLKCYNLGKLATRLSLPGLEVLRDPCHSRGNSHLRYVMIFYHGRHMGTVYHHTLWKDGEHFDPLVSKEIWDAVEKYAVYPKNGSQEPFCP